MSIIKIQRRGSYPKIDILKTRSKVEVLSNIMELRGHEYTVTESRRKLDIMFSVRTKQEPEKKF